MKKQLLYNFILFIIIINSYSQSVRITSIVEGDCPSLPPGSTAPSLIELYVDGTVDVTNLKLQFQFGFADFWVLNNSIGLGVYTNTFLYVVNDITAFDREFSGIRTPQNASTGVIISSDQGGDKVRLVDSSKANQVIDIYGVDRQDGEKKSWNYVNSYVKRKNGFGPNVSFIESEWNITPKNSLLFKGTCWGESQLNSIVKLQSHNTLSVGKVDAIDKNLKIYPNPTSNYIEIAGLEESEKYTIYDSNGKIVNQGVISKNEKIDINKLAKGAYFIKLNNGLGRKFIKN